MHLTLIRHGETDYNASGKFQGWADIPLNAAGHAQAGAVARRVAALAPPVTHVFSSDLSRARQTAEAIAEACGAPLRVTPELREINIGAWEGHTYADMRGVDAEAFAQWPWQAAPQGEGFGDVQARARAFVDSLAVEHSGDHVVIVSHGLLITALLCDLLGWNVREAWAERRAMHANTALSTLQFAGGEWDLETLACAQHI